MNKLCAINGKGREMARLSSEQIVVSIDIGTTKISVLIGHAVDHTIVEVIGVGTAPSYGLQKGVVVDIGKTVTAIRQAVKEAELSAGMTIDSATIGISGGHIKSFNSVGLAPIKRSRVTSSDIDRALEAAKAIVVPEGHHTLHVLPNYFLVDGQMVDDPRDMYGVRLEVHAHLILANIACVQNLIKCCQQAGVRVTDIVLEQLASAQAVLTSDERELGVTMIDIGGGTADVAVYRRANVAYTMVVPVAGNHFTNDLAVGLRLSKGEAERVKQVYGCVRCVAESYRSALCEMNRDVDVVLVDGAQKRYIKHADIAHILFMRSHELLSIIHNQLIVEQKLQRMMPAGLVLTGGGSLLVGLSEYAQKMFNMPARIGLPQVDFQLPQVLASPQYATGYGLLLYAVSKKKNGGFYEQGVQTVGTVIARMKSWIADFW